MNRILFLITAHLSFFGLIAQTNLDKGDLAFIGFNTAPSVGDPWIAAVVMAPIEPGTVFYLTNKEWGDNIVKKPLTSNDNYKSFTPASPGQGTYSITVDEFLSIGQIIKITISGTPATSVGTVAVDPNEASSLNLKNKSVMWIYQDDRDSDGIPEFVSAFYWNQTDMEEEYSSGGWSPPYYKNTGLDLVSSSNGKNAITLFYGSNNDKCGRFDPVRFQSNVGATINYSDPLAKNVYYGTSLNDIVWAFPSQQGAGNCWSAGGPGDLSVAENWLLDTANVVFDQYLYTCTADTSVGIVNVPGWFAKAQADVNWIPVSGTPNFSTETQDKEVIIDCDFTVSYGTDFKASKLSVSNSVTLTFEPFSSMAVYFDSDNKGVIELLVERSDAATLGSTAIIVPTSATLGGTYRVHGLITEGADSYHMSSPVKSALSDVVFKALDLTAIGGGAAVSNFALNDGSANVDNRNIYVWNPEGVINGQGTREFWQPTDSLHKVDFSDEAYTIFIPKACTPLMFTVTGPLLVQNADEIVNSPIGYSTDYTTADYSSPGHGAPFWSTSNSLKGWNFIRNPFMSYVDVNKMIDQYVSSFTDNGSQVFSNVVFQYAPSFSNQTNVENNYQQHNGSAGDANADFIAPFQAFFIQTSNDGATNPGAINKLGFSKKALDLNKRTKNPFWKTSSSGDKLSLSLWNKTSDNELGSVHLDQRENKRNLQYDGVKDALRVMDSRTSNICIGLDSLNYSIKTIPTIHDSISLNIGSGSPVQNQLLTIANHASFDNNYTSILIDNKLNIKQSLNTSSYTFYNDTLYEGYRFTWNIYAPGINPNRNAPTGTPKQWYSRYPDGFYVQGEKTYSRPIEIVDLNGRTLFTVEPERKTIVKVLEIDGLEPGVYFVKTEYGAIKILF